MKLIVSELAALGGYVSREFYHVMTELTAGYGWRHVETSRLRGGRRSLRRALVGECGALPRVVLFWEGYDVLAAHAAEVCELECRKCVFADDLHWWDEPMRLRKTLGFGLCDTVLSTYAYAWARFYPQFAGAKRVVWVPHAASPEFLLPFNARAENSVLVSGATTGHYPLRRRVAALGARAGFAIARHPHPGYHCGHDHARSRDVGRGYAEKINRHRAAFTDGPVYGYVVAKFFEIPATGALLLADAALAGPLARLGFQAGVHYLPVSDENLEERVEYVLDARNHRELDDIRRRGQELVRARHKTSDRARLIDEACRV